jgi:replicative DNA helicase
MINVEYPYDDSTEANILGAILADNKLFMKCEKLISPSTFRIALHKRVFEITSQMINRRQIASAKTIKWYMSDPEKEEFDICLEKFANEPLVWENFEDYCRHLRQLEIRRNVIDSSKSLLSIALSKDATDMTDRISTELNKVSACTLKESSVELELPSVDEDRLIDPISTGFLGLDKILKGGLSKGNLIILGARPSIGKSAFALNLAMTAVENKKGVLFLSFEMGSTEISERMAARIYQKCFTEVKKELSVAEINKEIRARSSTFYIVSKLTPRINGLKGYINSVMFDKKIDLVVIDHIHLITLSGGVSTKSKYEEMSTLSRMLKEIAMEQNIPVLALAQLSRRPEKTIQAHSKGKSVPREPMLADLRDSGSLEQDADVVILLHNEYEDDESYGVTQTPYKKTKVMIQKHRNGGVGEIKFRFYSEKMTYQEDDTEPITRSNSYLEEIASRNRKRSYKSGIRKSVN